MSYEQSAAGNSRLSPERKVPLIVCPTPGSYGDRPIENAYRVQCGVVREVAPYEPSDDHTWTIMQHDRISLYN
jgi:hypothetical protein